MTIKPESRWVATLAQTFAIITSVVVATWLVRGSYEQVIAEQRAVRTEIDALKRTLEREVVTAAQAERYASDFRWENRDKGIFVPDVKFYLVK